MSSRTFQPELVTEAEERRILLRIAEAQWMTEIGRRVQHYGYERVFEAERLWRKWLGRRSWRGRMTWDRFTRLRKTYPLPAARVVHSVYR